LPFLDWGKIYREQVHWSLRDTTGEKGKEMQVDMLAYIDWAIAFVKHEGRMIDEGHALYAKMVRWKPEDFPLKEVA